MKALPIICYCFIVIGFIVILGACSQLNKKHISAGFTYNPETGFETTAGIKDPPKEIKNVKYFAPIKAM